jgi:assimilatory nitrate reductase catalytic subunit
LAGAALAHGPQVCTCFNVSQSAITLHLQQCPGTAGERLASLQTTLKCGTNCGSCLPHLKKLVAAVPVAVAVAS